MVVDAVEEGVPNVNDRTGDGSTREKGSLARGYMFGGEVAHVRGENFEEKAVDCCGD